MSLLAFIIPISCPLCMYLSPHSSFVPMGWLVPALENRLFYFGSAHLTPSSSLSLNQFLSVYHPSLHLLWCSPILSCVCVWKQKNQTPVTIKEKKIKARNTILQIKILLEGFMVILPRFHTLQVFWVICEVQSFPTCCENQ